MDNDRRLIEDYLPIEAISKEASREKSVRKGHISTLHLWWARRPLVACRAAVYGALIPASQFVPQNGPDNKRQSLGRANAAKFVKRLCRYPSESKPEIKADTERAIQEAQGHILEAHAKRLSAELAEAKTTAQWLAWVDEFKWAKDKIGVTREDIEAYALDLNPVAHIIELCTLVYPQKYGKPDPNARGLTGPKNNKGQTTWGGLAEEVRYWGNRVLEDVRREVGDLYPPIPDPEYKGKRPEIEFNRKTGHWVAKGKSGSKKDNLYGEEHRKSDVPPGYLMPVAYLWTRTVKCKNPSCAANVPLSKLQWIRRERGDKPGRYIVLLRNLNRKTKRVAFTSVQGRCRSDLNPTEVTIKAGSVACPFCGAVNDDEYVKAQGCAGGIGLQLMAIGAIGARRSLRTYVGSEDIQDGYVPSDGHIRNRLEGLVESTGLTPPDEPVVRDGKQSVWVDLYGLTDFGKVFMPRQLIIGLALANAVRGSSAEMARLRVDEGHAAAVGAYLGMAVDRHMNQNNTLTIFNAQGETIEGAVNDKTLPMAWDFPEPNPFCGMTGSLQNAVAWVADVADEVGTTVSGTPAKVSRGSATSSEVAAAHVDAVVTDPPYYDNVSYAVLSDFFYGWLKRSVGFLFPQHFAGVGSPKKSEAVMDSVRHGGSRETARGKYEEFMEAAF